MAQQCKAKSKTSGKQCARPAIQGGTVCRYHGGAAPQVQRAARERLARMVNPALARLAELLDSEIEQVKLAAVKDILDRNGLKAADKKDIMIRNVHDMTDEELEQFAASFENTPGIQDRDSGETGT